MKVSCFEVVDSPILKVEDSVFVDEEGLLKSCDRFLFIASAIGRQRTGARQHEERRHCCGQDKFAGRARCGDGSSSDGCVYIPTLNRGGRRTRLTSAARPTQRHAPACWPSAFSEHVACKCGAWAPKHSGYPQSIAHYCPPTDDAAQQSRDWTDSPIQACAAWRSVV